MALYRRGKIWWMAYTADGRQRCESTSTSNKRLAQKILDKRKGEIAEGRFQLPKSNPPKFEAWAEQFLDSIQHASTKRRYTSSVRNLKREFDGVQLSHISVDRIELFKQNRLRAGIRAATVNRDLAVLRRMLKLAARQRLIAGNPFGEVDLLEERKERRQPHILTFAEQNRLLAVAPPRLRVLIILLTETGLRPGIEAFQLKWADIDFTMGAIHVRVSKTHAGRRLVPLTDWCKAELERWKRLTGPDFSEYVFPSLPNPRHPLQSGRKTWARALKKAKIEYFHLYDLRATFASRLSAADVADVFVSQMMGHAGGLLQTYSKAIDEYRREAIRKLESFRESGVNLAAASSAEGESPIQ